MFRRTCLVFKKPFLFSGPHSGVTKLVPGLIVSEDSQMVYENTADLYSGGEWISVKRRRGANDEAPWTDR